MKNFFLRVYTSIFFIIFFFIIVYTNKNYIHFFLLIILALSFFEILKIKLNIIKFIILIILLIFIYSFYQLLVSSNGKFFVIWLLFITWTTDSGAYVIGSLFGKKKIKFISPNKTYIGFFGGILLSQFSFFLTNLIQENILSMNFYKIIIIQLATSILVIFGDLLFSLFKRILNIKDYSNLLPGHGGILDRIDGLFFSTVYFYIIFIL